MDLLPEELQAALRAANPGPLHLPSGTEGPLSVKETNAALQAAAVAAVKAPTSAAPANVPSAPSPHSAAYGAADHDHTADVNTGVGENHHRVTHDGAHDSKGLDVKADQTMLKYLGFDLGNSGKHHNGIDGDFGNSTKKAVMQFQEQHGLTPADGNVGDETRAALVKAFQSQYNTEHPNAKLADSDGLISDATKKAIAMEEAKLGAIGAVSSHVHNVVSGGSAAKDTTSVPAPTPAPVKNDNPLIRT